MNEIWNSIPGYSRYEASTLGQIRNRVTGKTLKPGPAVGGVYRTLDIVDDSGRRASRYVHVLVAATFHGAKPFPAAQVRHLDGDGANNAAWNLSWGTAAQNAQDKRLHGTHRLGEQVAGAKLTADEVRDIRALHALGLTVSVLAVDYSVSESTIYAVINRRTWAHVTDSAAA
jgi:hypothetical protein